MPGGVAAAPEWLSDVALAEWDRLSPELITIGLLTMADQTEFAVYCQSYSELIEAENELVAGGRTQVTKDGFCRKSPWLSIRDEAWKKMNQAAQQFGLTPASRSRIEIPEATQTNDKSAYIA